MLDKKIEEKYLMRIEFLENSLKISDNYIRLLKKKLALNDNELLKTYTIWLSDKVRDKEELNELVNDFLKGYNCDTDK